jgi:predicted transcriptional regulator YheO
LPGGRQPERAAARGTAERGCYPRSTPANGAKGIARLRKVMTEKFEVTFSLVDHIILNSYKIVMEGLSNYLGDGYEFVLHSLEDLDHSVVKIINGQHTGRKEGAPITDIALRMSSEITNHQQNYISYHTRNRKGEPLKATTIAIRGERDRVIGLLCINFYLNTPLFEFISSLSDATFAKAGFISENFVENSTELITEIVLQIKKEVDSNKEIPLSLKNKEIISILYNQGIFNLKDAVAKVSKTLKISSNTVYMHLRKCQNPS